MSQRFWWDDLHEGVVNAKRELMLDGLCRLWGVSLSFLDCISVTPCHVNIRTVSIASVATTLFLTHIDTHHTRTLPKCCFLQHGDINGFSARRWAKVVLQSHQWQLLAVCRSNHMIIKIHGNVIFDTVMKIAARVKQKLFWKITYITCFGALFCPKLTPHTQTTTPCRSINTLNLLIWVILPSWQNSPLQT